MRTHPSKSVRSWQVRAPYSSDCESLPQEIFPSGISTMLHILPRAAYAAMEAEVLPVEAQATQRNFPWCADEAATVMPVSLNDAVGFMPWCFALRFSTPVARAHRGRRYRGVLPSRSVMTCSSGSGICGRSSRKRQTPLWSSASREVRRLSQRDYSAAGSKAGGLKASGPEVHPGKKNSNRSPQVVQRKSWPPESGVAPQAMQRRREAVSAVRVVDNGNNPVESDD